MYKEGRISSYLYKKYCYALRDLLRMAEEDYQVNRLRTINSNSKKTWKVLNGMLGRQRKDISRHFLIDGREVSDPGTIADGSSIILPIIQRVYRMTF